jgi:hypothetical protein
MVRKTDQGDVGLRREWREGMCREAINVEEVSQLHPGISPVKEE